MEKQVMNEEKSMGNTVIPARGELNYLIVIPLFNNNPDEYSHFPLGIPYVSAAMKEAGFKVFTLNLNYCEEPYEQLKELIVKDNIDVIMTGGLSPQFAQVKTIFDVAREVAADIITICGGGLISGDPEASMEALEIVDYGIIGEGEITNVELCKALENGLPLENIEGIIFGSPNNYIVTKRRKEIADVDSIPFPDYEGFDYDKQIAKSTTTEVFDYKLPGDEGKRVATIITSRSCPFACTFCFHTTGRKYRQRSLDQVFEEIDYLVEQYDIKYLSIQDELFAQSFERLKEFCDRISQYEIRWNVCLRVENIDEPLIKMLQAANCIQINIGIESADNDVLKSMRKKITIEQIEAALECASKLNMQILGGFIFGDICETKQSAQKTIDWWKKHQKFGIALRMIKVYPGSHLYSYAVNNDIIKDRVEFCRQGCPPVNVSKMSSEEIGWLISEIMTLPYTNRNLVENVQLKKVDYSKNKYDVSGECSVCGHKDTWGGLVPFAKHLNNCTQCGTAQRIAIPQNIGRTIADNFKRLTESKSCAVWGMADYFISYVNDHLELFQSMKVHFVDESEDTQRICVAGKKVHAPDTIYSKGVKCVIVAPSSYLSIIKPQVHQNEMNIEVISINQLMNPDFLLDNRCNGN